MVGYDDLKRRNTQMVKQTIDEVFASPLVVGFSETAFRFFRFEIVLGISDSIAPSLFKFLLVFIAALFNVLGVLFFFLLSILLCVGLVLYLIPLLIFNVITMYFD